MVLLSRSAGSTIYLKQLSINRIANGDMDLADAKRLKELESENTELKKMLANIYAEKSHIGKAQRKKR